MFNYLVVRSCGRAVVRSCGRAVVRSCGHAVMRSCGHAVVRSSQTKAEIPNGRSEGRKVGSKLVYLY